MDKIEKIKSEIANALVCTFQSFKAHPSTYSCRFDLDSRDKVVLSCDVIGGQHVITFATQPIAEYNPYNISSRGYMEIPYIEDVSIDDSVPDDPCLSVTNGIVWMKISIE